METGEMEWVVQQLKLVVGGLKYSVKKSRGLYEVSAKNVQGLPLGVITFSDVSPSFANHDGFYNMKSDSWITKRLSQIEKDRRKKFDY